jgi:hypothetical protein
MRTKEKNMKWIIGLLACLMVVPILAATKSVPMTEVLNAQSIIVDQEQVYIVQTPEVFIYSLKDFKLKKKFGKAGEGPQEFKLFPNMPLLITVEKDDIVAKSMGKLSYYAKDGTFKKEVRVKAGFVLAMKTLGDQMIGIENIMSNQMRYLGINVYDSNLNKLQQVKKIPDSIQRGKGMRFLNIPQAHADSFVVLGNKFLVAWEKDAKIEVYDAEGKAHDPIKLEAEKIALSDDYKAKVVEFFKNDPRTKPYYQFIKPVSFPDYFPGVREMRVSDNTLYVFTYMKEKGNVQCYTFDKNLKFKEKIYVPLEEMNITEFYPFAIKSGTLYQMVENLDTESWELQYFKIK